MNPPISRRSAVLLFLGAVAIFLLGALTHIGPSPAPQPVATAAAAVRPEPEPFLPGVLSPGLSEILRLTQHHVDESVILAYVENSGLRYSATADDIVYLTDSGVSQKVIVALLRPSPAAIPARRPAAQPSAAIVAAAPVPAPPPAPSPASPEQPPQVASVDDFYTALAPYGTWFEMPKYGLVWQPSTSALNIEWHPYLDGGQWLYTENGWYWNSTYSWGGIAFHYGRWTQLHNETWAWVPDNVWGPAWVSWRATSDYTGWAPLPPGVSLAVGSGLLFNNQHVSTSFDFNIPASWYAFVDSDYLQNPNLMTYSWQGTPRNHAYKYSKPVNNYSFVNNKIVNRGPGGIATITQMPSVPMQPTASGRHIMEHETPASTPAVEQRIQLSDYSVPRANTVIPITTSMMPQPQHLRTSDLAESRLAYSYTPGPYGARAESSLPRETTHREIAPNTVPAAWNPPVQHEAVRANEPVIQSQAAVAATAPQTRTGK